MTDDTNMRDVWRSEVGDAAEPLWNAFRMTEPPVPSPLEHDRRRPTSMWLALAASWLGIAMLFAWNMELRIETAEARERAALMMLAAERSDRVLAGLADVRRSYRNPAITAELLHLLKTSDDPNVQLEALDLLLDDVLKDAESRRDVLDEIRFNRPFIELALQAQEIRT